MRPERPTNLLFRALENVNIAKRHYPRVLAARFRMSKDYKRELFITPREEGEDHSALYRFGDGHLRSSFCDYMRFDLGYQRYDPLPPFEQLWAFYNLEAETVKDLVINPYRR